MTRISKSLVVAGVLVFTSLAGSGAPAPASPATSARGFALVELFTSEGCSSCPPADALLGELVSESARSGRRVYALSFHVTYWDHLGWKDRFSSAAFTQRQRDYARRFELRSLYTPEMVVNGSEEFVGSDKREATRTIDAALAKPEEIHLTLESTARGPEIEVRVVASPAPRDARLFVAWVDAAAVSNPDTGENDGQTLRHANVVRDLETVELGSRPMRLKLTREVARAGSVIAWVQGADAGRVLGAASIAISGGARPAR